MSKARQLSTTTGRRRVERRLALGEAWAEAERKEHAAWRKLDKMEASVRDHLGILPLLDQHCSTESMGAKQREDHQASSGFREKSPRGIYPTRADRPRTSGEPIA